MNRLVCFGYGYSAHALAQRLLATGSWHVTGTSRSKDTAHELESANRTIIEVPHEHPDNYADNPNNDPLAAALRAATHVVISAPPVANGDPLLSRYKDTIKQAKHLRWVGYLSTIGIYGDQNNAWVDETTAPAPQTERTRRRVAAETTWQQFANEQNIGVDIFRLAGIYGPGRSVIDKLNAGTARRIEKPGQVFNRIHVDDIAAVLEAAMQIPDSPAPDSAAAAKFRIFNVTDNEPAPPQDVVAFAAQLLGLKPPPLIPFAEADLSPMGRSFYNEQRRVRNEKIRNELGISMRYPTYREGLRAILKATP